LLDGDCEKADYGKERRGCQDCQAEIIDIFIPVLKGDRREWLSVFKGVRDVVVGDMKVDGFKWVVRRLGGFLGL
jgi:hypothetical protein